MLLLMVEVLLYVHRNRRFIRDVRDVIMDVIRDVRDVIMDVIRDVSPGRPPRLSHSSCALKMLLPLRRSCASCVSDSVKGLL